jgi:membrane-bound ClpP family serine protease
VLLLTAIVLAVFVLSAPWNGLVLGLGLVGEAGELVFGIWYSRRRRAAADAERMIGTTVKVIESCKPRGYVSYKGERWDAVCAAGVDSGERARISAVNGRLLELEQIAEK